MPDSVTRSVERFIPAGRTDGRTDGLTELVANQVNLVTLADAYAGVHDEIISAGQRLNQGRRPERIPAPPRLRRLVYERDNWTCQWCGDRSRHLTLDHVIPVAAQGADDSRNLRTLCWTCNAERSNFRTDAALIAPLGVVKFCTPCLPYWEDRPAPVQVSVFCGMCGLTSWTEYPEDIL